MYRVRVPGDVSRVARLVSSGSTSILALLLLVAAAAPASGQVWNVAGDGSWANGSTNFTPAYTNGGSATFSNTAGGTITLSGTISPSSTTVSAASGTYTFTGTGITAGSLSKSGAGTLILSNSNSLNGNTTISGGVLQVGDGSNATARVGTGAMSVSSGTLSLSLNASGTLGNSSVTSSGGIQNVGTGRVTLANGSLQGTTVDGGTGGIVLSNLIVGDFFLRGDVTFGSNDANRTVQATAPGAIARIVTAGAFWWIGSGSAANALSLDVASGVTVSLNAGQAAGALYYNNLSGEGNFTYNGQGTGYILGTSTLSGTLTASNRDISFGNGGSTGAAGATRIVANANVAFDSTTDTTYSGTMSGGGALVKKAGNVLSITGANTYTGATTLNAGTLRIGTGGTTGSLSTSSAISGSAGATLAFARSDTVTSGTHFASTIGGSINVTQMGPGTLVLNGANTFTGTTRVDAGTLQIGNGSTTGSLSTSSAITGSAGATLAFARSDTVTQGTHFGSVIGGAVNVSQRGSGTLVLNGANTFTGTTRIVSGSLSIGNALTLQNSVLDLNPADAGTVSAIDQNSTVGGLAGTRNLDMRTRTLSIGNNNQSTTYTGTLSNGALTKIGSGTLTLTAAHAYAGTTTVSGGVLQVGDGSNATARVGTGALSVGSGTLSLNLNASGTLGNSSVTSSGLIQNVGTGRVTLANGSMESSTVDGGTAGIVLSNLITSNTSFYLQGDVTFGSSSSALSVRPTASGATARIVNAGTFWWIGSGSAANALSLDVASGVTVSLNTSQEAGALYYNNLSGAGNFTYNGNATGYILGTSTLTGTLTAGNRDISFGNGGTTGAAGATRIQANANVTFNTTTDGTYAGAMSGAGALIKTAANTLTLSGSNDYTGGTTVSAGRLVGTASSLQGAIMNNAAVTFDQGTAGTYAGLMSGSGSVLKSGVGVLQFTGAHTYTGATSVVAGGLQLNGSIAGSLSIASGATLSGTGTVGGNATIAGAHSPGNSPGSQTFNSDLTYAAGAVVNWELIANTTGSAGVSYDQIIIPTGDLTFSGSTTLALSFNGVGSVVDWTNAFWDVNRSWTVYDLSGGTTTNVGNLSLGGSLLDSLGSSLSPTGRGYFTTSLSGQDVMLNFVAVPEPSTYAMALAGLACGGFSMWRRRKQRGRREDDPALPSSLAPRSHSSSRSSAGNRFRTCHWPG